MTTESKQRRIPDVLPEDPDRAVLVARVADPERSAPVVAVVRGDLLVDVSSVAPTVSELLDLSDHIREIILARRPASEIKRAAKEEGMMFLRESALEKVFQGVTTLREINKVTFVD